MKTTVIHHSADFDGIFCREIARKFLPDAELIGWDFSDKPLAFPDSDIIYILDLPVDRVFNCKFEGSSVPSDEGHLQPVPIENDYVNAAKLETALHDKKVVWVDHHKSSIDSHPKNIPGYRIDGVAACRLAWQWFKYRDECTEKDQYKLPLKPDFVGRFVTEPLAVRLAGEYDIWDKRDDRADTFQFGLRSRELVYGDWKSMLSTEKITIGELEKRIAANEVGIINPDGTTIPSIICELLKNGAMLQKYQQRNDDGMMHRSFLQEFEGLKFLCLTTARCNSLTFSSKDIPETGHDALMGFYFNGSKWNVSLYHASHRKDLDLSTIAVKYGGGGHRGACGFQTDKLPFNL